MHAPNISAEHRARLDRLYRKPLYRQIGDALSTTLQREWARNGLFSLKTFVAALLAFYVALSIGLSRPYWAVTTCYIVAQPLVGAMLSKAVFRLVGTVVGAGAAVIIVPTFVNAPELLAAVLALWLGLCTYLAVLDRTPRAYMALLAGYSACIVGIPAVDAPNTIFFTASQRVQEIGIGIVCVSLIHSLFIPSSVLIRLRATVSTILVDAEQWSCSLLAVSPRSASLSDSGRHHFIVALHELHLLSIHLPFDSTVIVPRMELLRSLEERLVLLLPFGGEVEDRLIQIKRLGRYSPAIESLVEDIREWLMQGHALSADMFVTRARALEPPVGEELDWTDLLTLSFLDRLADLVRAHADCRTLRDILMRQDSALPPAPMVMPLTNRARPMHRDHRTALQAAFATASISLIGCLIWIATQWPDGGSAVVLAVIICALFSHLDDPAAAVRSVFLGAIGATAGAAICRFIFMPQATNLEIFALVLAPSLLTIGVFMAQPNRLPIGIGAILTFPAIAGLSDRYDDSFPDFINTGTAQILGALLAVMIVGPMRTVLAEQTSYRLLRASRRDLMRIAASNDGPDISTWINRMLDRICILYVRTSASGRDFDEQLNELAVNTRIGIAVGELRRFQNAALMREKQVCSLVLQRIRQHYESSRAAAASSPDLRLIRSVDRALCRINRGGFTSGKRDVLLAYVSLRRNLAFDAPLPACFKTLEDGKMGAVTARTLEGRLFAL